MEAIQQQQFFIYVAISTEEVVLIVDKNTPRFLCYAFHFFLHLATLSSCRMIVSARGDATESHIARPGYPFGLRGNIFEVFTYFFPLEI